MGMGLLGLILALGILGGLSAMAVVGLSGSTLPDTSELTLPTPAPSDASQMSHGSDNNAAAVAACRSDYQAVQSAASVYRVLNGADATRMRDLQSILKDPVTSPYFIISIDPQNPGVIEVATSGHAARPGDGNCAYAR
jgi:hypothetical protein